MPIDMVIYVVQRVMDLLGQMDKRTDDDGILYYYYYYINIIVLYYYYCTSIRIYMYMPLSFSMHIDTRVYLSRQRLSISPFLIQFFCMSPF